MNKFFILNSLILFGLTSHAQIGSRANIEKAAEVHVKPYDSITDVVTYENAAMFLGQDIYLVPKSEAYEKSKQEITTGYLGFVINKINIQEWNTFKRVPYPVMNASRPGFASDYNAMKGQYYKIVEVIDQTDGKKFTENEGPGIYFRLQGRENKESLYYAFGTYGKKIPTGIHEGFIFEGVYQKAKKEYLKKKYIARSDFRATELNTGTFKEYTYNHVWMCTDITLIERTNRKFQVMALILRDSSANEIAVCLNPEVSGFDLDISDFKSEEELKEAIRLKAEKEKQDIAAYRARETELIRKYGKKFGPMIAEGRVAVGMSKQMCIESWGEPDHINKTATVKGIHEQWVYSLRSYIYFDAGMLTAIQTTEW